MKSHVLLTTALFLICAPAPDGRDIAELTSNFIVPENNPGLSASEPISSVTREQNTIPRVEAAGEMLLVETGLTVARPHS